MRVGVVVGGATVGIGIAVGDGVIEGCGTADAAIKYKSLEMVREALGTEVLP